MRSRLSIVLETQVSALTEASKVQAKEFAKGKVAAAIAAGKIPAQNADLIKKWEGMIEVDAKAVELLDQLPVNPALLAMVKAGAAAGTGGASTANTDAEKFVQVVKAKSTELKDKSKGLDAAITAEPKLYQAWRDANGQPVL